jgi:hypothetical protein
MIIVVANAGTRVTGGVFAKKQSAPGKATL